MSRPQPSAQVTQLLSDWRWRLNNLYWITNEDGKRTIFEMREEQAQLFDRMHYSNIILKARQLGFTTFLQIFMLDACVFNKDIRAGTIAHTLEDAQRIFHDKVKYPYDNLPEQIRSAVRDVASNKTELELSNNSSIRVGTSLRSGTLQYLHISEYGKLCAKFPEKAREVRTGALNTVQSGQIVFIESTAEGQEGHFFEMCQTAQTKARAQTSLTPLDFKFHFFPWWRAPKYTLHDPHVVITDDYARYFAKLADLGISLSPEQKAWYVKKAETQLDDMKREYPSTPDEAFEASVEGAYYAQQTAKADLEGRIGAYPADPGFPVHTAWDIGFGDETAIWFFQVLYGVIRLVDYYENSGEGMPHYLDVLAQRRRDKFYAYAEHFMPHDIRVHEWTNGLTRIEQMTSLATSMALGTIRKVPQHFVDDGINATRQLLGICQFNAVSTDAGLKALRTYRKDWDEDRGVWKDKPRHDAASHGADAFRSIAMTYRELVPELVRVPGRILTVGPANQVTYDDLLEMDEWDKPRGRI